MFTILNRALVLMFATQSHKCWVCHSLVSQYRINNTQPSASSLVMSKYHAFQDGRRILGDITGKVALYVLGTRMGPLLEPRLEASTTSLRTLTDLRPCLFLVGDIIGCGIDFTQNKIFYTKNGSLLGMLHSNPATFLTNRYCQERYSRMSVKNATFSRPSDSATLVNLFTPTLDKKRSSMI